MKTRIVSRELGSEYEVCELLNRFIDYGWDLNICFIKIVKGVSTFYVFYEEKMDRPYESDGRF